MERNSTNGLRRNVAPRQPPASNSSVEWSSNSQSSLSHPSSSSASPVRGHVQTRGAAIRSVQCGDGCLAISQKKLLRKYEFCSFAAFGSPNSNPPQFLRQNTGSSSGSTSSGHSAPVVGRVHTTALHNPASGKRHFALPVRNQTVRFEMPGACDKTMGVAVVDILAFDGQCIVNPGERIASQISGDPRKPFIDLVIEVSFPSFCNFTYSS